MNIALSERQQIIQPRPLGLHSGQAEVFKEVFLTKSVRYATCVCSRGWGKSFFGAVAAKAAVHELLSMPAHVPNKNVYIVAPTNSQVQEVYMPYLKLLGLHKMAVKIWLDPVKFLFLNDVVLRLVSYETVERLRGNGAYFIVLDEVRDWTKGIGLKAAWEGVLKPTISTRWSPKIARKYGVNPGRALTISTTRGYDYLYDMFNMPEFDPEWRSWQFDYTSSPYLDVDEVENDRNMMDPITFNREYLASFENSGHNVFYCFNRKIHVTRDLTPLQDWEEIHVAIDFNVGLQCSAVCVIRGGQVHVIGEFKGSPNTEELAKAIKARYGLNSRGDKRIIKVYPDPTGNSRKTNAPVGVTDMSILREAGFIVCARKKSPPIVDSVAAVNRLLMSSNEVVSMYIHPSCKGVIESLERTTWLDNNPNSATIDKSKGIEHYSDGLRYLVEYLFPVKLGGIKAVIGNTF